MSTFKNACDSLLKRRIEQWICGLQAEHDQHPEEDKSASLNLLIDSTPLESIVFQTVPEYQNALNSLIAIEGEKQAKNHLYKQIKKGIVAYVYGLLADLDHEGEINLARASIDSSSLILDVWLLSNSNMPKQIRNAYDNLLRHMFRPEKSIQGNEITVDVLSNPDFRDSDKIATTHVLFSLKQSSDDEDVKLFLNHHLNKASILSEHENDKIKENQYCLRALGAILD